jgi:hypothetical protein
VRPLIITILQRSQSEKLTFTYDGSITELLKWFSPIKLFIFKRKPRNRVSGVRFQVSVVRNELVMFKSVRMGTI